MEDITYALSPWSVLLVKNHAIHRAVIDVSVPYDRIIIYLNHDHFKNLMPDSRMMECFENTGESECCLLMPDEKGIAELSAAVEDFEALQGDDRFGADTIRETLIIRILVYISRFSRESSDAVLPEKEAYDRKISAVISYINANLNTDLSVDRLAGSVYLSRYHFMRLFKEQTGTTIHAYIREKRLLYASRLIREGTPAGQAAQESGFSDYSTFSRAFRDCFNARPSDIKK